MLELIGLSLFSSPSKAEWAESWHIDDLQQLEESTDEVQRIYFIRHGQSVFNIPDENGIVYTQGTSLDAPLTEKGIEQAEALSQKLEKKIDRNNLEIVASSALRAQQTASVFLKNWKLGPLRTYAGFCELGSGKWEGKPKDAAYMDEFEKWKALSAKDKFFAPKVSTGESYDEVAKRSLAALSAIASDPSLKGKTIFVISHYMAINAMAFNLSNIPLSEEPGSDLPEVKLDNCDLLMVELPAGGGLENAKVKGVIHSSEKN